MGKKIPKIFCPSAKMHVKTDRLYVNGSYARAVNRSGGVLFTASAISSKEELGSLIEMADGILIQGGCDIHPKMYGQKPIIDVTATDPDRDEIELETLRVALEKNIPTLGICRGMQMMNIAMGGDLHQDLSADLQTSHTPLKGSNRDFRSHDVGIVGDSILSRVFNGTQIEVNSLHHQGIDRLGRGLRVSARAPDGLIEGVELEDHSFMVGVQWHPEELGEASKPLFDAFINSLIL